MCARRRLGFEIRLPIIQAPMAGSGINTPQLVSAVSNAGGLGSVATAYLTIPQVEQSIRQVREQTQQSFAVNLFAPAAREELTGDVESQIRLLAPIHQRIGLAAPALPKSVDEPFQELIELLISLHVFIVSFTFGILPQDSLERLKAQDVYLMGTATTVVEAKLLEAAGVDAVIAQGSESGGHRGSFLSAAPSSVGTMALVPQIVDEVKIPVIASGGIMDGRGVVAALALGASAVQMGTAFLTCAESGAPEVYKQAVVQAADDSTALTRAFSGRWARGIRNQFMEQSERSQSEPISFPWQNALTRDMRSAAARQGDKELLSLWAGQAARLARRMPAADLMAALESEIHDTRRSLTE